MTVNGETIKSMEWVSLPMLTRPNTTENGKKMLEKVKAPIITQMEIDTKENGTAICKMEMGLTTMLMETSTKASGKTADNMDKVTISILLTKASIRAIGKTAKKKALENW